MAPGLKSAGARFDESIQKEQIVAVMAEGKEHAMAIGLQKMSCDEVKEATGGIAIDNIHYLNDGIFRLTKVQ
jgi:PUA domain protein